jgi:hypothetical protein
MAPAGPEHADVVAHVGRILRTQTTFLVREEKPVTLPEHSEPELDIALVKPRRYLDAHPFPDDVLMIIEVADTSLDKNKKGKSSTIRTIPYPRGLDRLPTRAICGMLLESIDRYGAFSIRPFKARRARPYHLRNDTRYSAQPR